MGNRAQFLRDVLAWPGEKSPGFVNLHTNMLHTKSGEKIVYGWAFTTVEDFDGMSGWLGNTTTFFNAWMCMSQQTESIEGSGKYRKAVRKAKNATWLKSIWVDIDVEAKPSTWETDKPWPHYETIAEAKDALAAFVKKVGLPEPSYVVHSGGGLHVYWASDVPMTVEDWYPYADGLKALVLQEGVLFDAVVMTDAARLMRVPDTLNHKYDPPRKVELQTHSTTYSFPQSLLNLKNFKTGKSAPKAPATNGLCAFDGKPDPAFSSLNPHNDTIQAGIDLAKPLHLVPANPIFFKHGCRWLHEALLTGGKNLNEPQWHLSVSCTAFMENGNEIAHAISKGHDGYSQNTTQEKFDRAVAERANGQLGYPQCATIEGAGSTACEECPLRGKGKSPLHIRPVKPAEKVAAAVTAKVTPPPGSGLSMMPDAYQLNGEGQIIFDNGRSVKGEWVSDWVPLFYNQIHDIRVLKDPDTYMVRIDKDLSTLGIWITLTTEDVTGMGVDKVLAKLGLLPAADTKNITRFFMSFMHKMWRAKAAPQQAKYGWYHPNGQQTPDGFAYGGQLFRTNGMTEPSIINDSELVERYSPCGTVAQWHKTASYVFRQKRPDFDAIIATAFGAPLMELTGTTGAILATMGDRGAGKSYALGVAAAVWGDPRTTKEGETTTHKSLMNKLGKVNCLPAFWDEISDEPIQRIFYRILQDFSNGTEGSRLFSNLQQRKRGTWCTIININGNKSFRSFIVQKQRDHGAGLRRILEYWVPREVPNPVGQVSTNESDKAMGLLKRNYGCVGLEYAEYLAKNYNVVMDLIERNTEMLVQELQPYKDESYWLSLCACLYTGAQLAKRLPTPVDFDIPALKDFLTKVFLENRAHIGNAMVTPNAASYAADFLSEFLKDKSQNTVWTKGAPKRRGRCDEIPTTTRLPLHGVMKDGCHVQFDQVNRQLIISRAKFEDWCDIKTEKRVYSTLVASLEKNYGLEKDPKGQLPKKKLAAGTAYTNAMQERSFVIDVTGHADLEEHMDNFGPVDMTGPLKEAAE